MIPPHPTVHPFYREGEQRGGIQDFLNFQNVREGVVRAIVHLFSKKQRGVNLNIKNSKKYKDIKNSLLETLEKSKNNTPYFVNLVEDYMSLYETKELAKAEIKNKGVMVEYQNGKNQSGYKKNDMIEVNLKVNAQMIKILDKLGINIDGDLGFDDDEL